MHPFEAQAQTAVEERSLYAAATFFRNLSQRRWSELARNGALRWFGKTVHPADWSTDRIRDFFSARDIAFTPVTPLPRSALRGAPRTDIDRILDGPLAAGDALYLFNLTLNDRLSSTVIVVVGQRKVRRIVSSEPFRRYVRTLGAFSEGRKDVGVAPRGR